METGYSKLENNIKLGELHTDDKLSGNIRLASWLIKYKKINPIQALELGIYRLSARIYDLRHDYDWSIDCNIEQMAGKKKHSSYKLISQGKMPKSQK